MMGKSTAAETNLRVEKITEFLLLGWSRRRICEYALNEGNWGISDSQVDRYIKKARLEIEAQSEKNIAAEYTFAVARLEHLYSKALEQDNLSLAVKIIKEIISLQGLSRPKIVDSEPEGNAPSAFYSIMDCYAKAMKSTVTDEQLKEIVGKATALGSNVNIEEASFQDSLRTDYLDLAVEDHKLIGRGRTREELERDGWKPIDPKNASFYR